MDKIVIVNQSSVLTDEQVRNVIPALQDQVTKDFAPIWGIDATIYFGGDNAAPGEWPLYILDTTDVPGAGGYHLDDNGKVEGKVFARDAMDAGEAWTVDLSHELLEMLADPSAGTDPSKFIALVGKWEGYKCLREVCLAGDTVVPLTDGSRPMIGELATRGALKARRTAKSARTVRVILTDGTWVRCTPEHRFLLSNGKFARARDLRGGDVLPAPTLADGVDAANVYAVALGEGGCDVKAAKNLPNSGRAQFAVADGLPAKLPVSRHATFDRSVHHVFNVSAREKVIGPHARRRIARMTRLLAGSQSPLVEFERKAMRIDDATAIPYLAVSFARERANPQPALIGLLHAGPKAIFQRRRSAVVSGKSRLGVSGSVRAHTLPMRGAQALGARGSLAIRNGAFHAKIIDRVEADGQAEVFDLTAPSRHNFAVGAGVFVHNCDAVEDDSLGYGVPGADGKPVLLSDFVTPAYFYEPSRSQTGFDFKNHLAAAAPTLLQGGYLGILDPDGQWSQVSDFALAPRSRAHRSKRRALWGISQK